jgi:hypothetical protein
MPPKILAWISTLFVIFVFAIKQYNDEQRYTFYRTAGLWTVNKFA